MPCESALYADRLTIIFRTEESVFVFAQPMGPSSRDLIERSGISGLVQRSRKVDDKYEPNFSQRAEKVWEELKEI